jgi:hypothetical protein
MKVTYLRNESGNKLNHTEMNMIIERLDYKFNEAGFLTSVYQLNGTSLNISQGGKCFSVDVSKLGHNARLPYVTNQYGTYCGIKYIRGYKKTSLPTWDQRVRFNNILNEVLDFYKVTCNIKSGPFVIRDRKNGSMHECDWSYLEYTQDHIVELDDDLINEGDELYKAHQKEKKEIKRQANLPLKKTMRAV